MDCILLESISIDWPNNEARNVFPVPGKPSIKTWPPTKTEIVNEWVSTDTYQSSHSYRLLKEAIERDLVSEGDDGKLHINESE